MLHAYATRYIYYTVQHNLNASRNENKIELLCYTYVTFYGRPLGGRLLAGEADD